MSDSGLNSYNAEVDNLQNLYSNAKQANLLENLKSAPESVGKQLLTELGVPASIELTKEGLTNLAKNKIGGAIDSAINQGTGAASKFYSRIKGSAAETLDNLKSGASGFKIPGAEGLKVPEGGSGGITGVVDNAGDLASEGLVSRLGGSVLGDLGGAIPAAAIDLGTGQSGLTTAKDVGIGAAVTRGTKVLSSGYNALKARISGALGKAPQAEAEGEVNGVDSLGGDLLQGGAKSLSSTVVKNIPKPSIETPAVDDLGGDLVEPGVLHLSSQFIPKPVPPVAPPRDTDVVGTKAGDTELQDVNTFKAGNAEAQADTEAISAQTGEDAAAAAKTLEGGATAAAEGGEGAVTSALDTAAAASAEAAPETEGGGALLAGLLIGGSVLYNVFHHDDENTPLHLPNYGAPTFAPGFNG